MSRTKVFQISRNAVEQLAADYGTPLLVLSLEEIKNNYEILQKYLHGIRIHYAIKANPHPEILRLMDECNACFDVASDGEIRLLHEMGIDGSRIIYANPVKTQRGLLACRECGVTKMTFDSICEIDKIKKYCPNATVLLRLRIDHSLALVDLNKKFGTGPEKALELMLRAREAGLDMAGIAFHVGSQTTQATPYLEALDLTRELFDEAIAQGLKLRILDIGGGFPIPSPDTEFDLPSILNCIDERLEEKFPQTEIWAEPGRYICGTAVNLITSVIGVTERKKQAWYFLDEGLYGTFSGILFDQWDFELISSKEENPKIVATFAGPSCDSFDILFHDRITPQLEMGDLLLVPACGAYTSASATTFNGFSKARFVIWEDVNKNCKIQ